MTKDEKLALLKLPLDEKIKRTFNMRQEFYDLAKKIADWHTVTFKDADLIVKERRNKMIEKLKELWKWHGPILMTRSKVFSLLVSQEVELDKINNKIARAAIRPVIFSLEELKKNTWDKDRVEWIQQYLKDSFEVEDDEN